MDTGRCHSYYTLAPRATTRLPQHAAFAPHSPHLHTLPPLAFILAYTPAVLLPPAACHAGIATTSRHQRRLTRIATCLPPL